MDTNKEKALKQYNAKWAGEHSWLTRKLYRAATDERTAQYGVRLQEHVLFLLGDPTAKKMNQKKLSWNAMNFVRWMLL